MAEIRDLEIIGITWNYCILQENNRIWESYEKAVAGKKLTFGNEEEEVKCIREVIEVKGDRCYIIESENYTLKIHNPNDILYKQKCKEPITEKRESGTEKPQTNY